MVKIGGIPTEDKWNKLSQQQIKSLIFEINIEVSRIVPEMEVKLELLTVKSAIHDWYNLVSHFQRKLSLLRECFPPYSAEKYRSMEELQHRNTLKEFKEFNKRKDYQERCLTLKADISALEKFVLEKDPVKTKHTETAQQLDDLRTQIDTDRAFLKEAKTNIKNLTSTIIREKKAMQREISHMKRNKANADQKLSELRETLKQKDVLLRETIEQRRKEEEAVKKELQENKRLCKIRDDIMRAAKQNAKSSSKQ